MCHTDLSPLNISAEQLNTAFGDGSVTLPDHIDWPAHWPRESARLRRIRKAMARLSGHPAPRLGRTKALIARAKRGICATFGIPAPPARPAPLGPGPAIGHRGRM